MQSANIAWPAFEPRLTGHPALRPVRTRPLTNIHAHVGVLDAHVADLAMGVGFQRLREGVLAGKSDAAEGVQMGRGEISWQAASHHTLQLTQLLAVANM